MTSDAPSKSPWLKSTQWLAEHLNDPKVAIVDGSYYLTTMNRNAKEEYAKEHIPGAVFFDIDAVADKSTDLPHMLPGPTIFGEAVGALGIGNDHTVVVYDGVGLYSAPRVWWTFRIFGAKNVYILDGGLPRWKSENRAARSRRGEADAADVQRRDEYRRRRHVGRGPDGALDRRQAGRGCALCRRGSAAKSLSPGKGCAPVICRVR